jgi:hypothetical protein
MDMKLNFLTLKERAEIEGHLKQGMEENVSCREEAAAAV